ncbi:MAG: NADH:flavin oxidoreductase [Arachnia sp.]
MLAPMTNRQSNQDGTLTSTEIDWLVSRAQGGFGFVTTAAAFVSRAGKAWHGQLGISADSHVRGLARLAAGLRGAGAVSAVQLNHGGLQGNPIASGEQLIAPWRDTATGAQELTTDQIYGVINDFASAAVRAERAGFDGVQVQAGHAYLLCQFLEPDRNRRTDGYGGDYSGRTHIISDIIEAIRARTGTDFQVGVRLSPERMGIDPAEMRRLAGDLMAAGKIDYVDLSMWNVRKQPDATGQPRLLIDSYASLERHSTKLGVGGSVSGSADGQWCLEHNADFVAIGTAAILDREFAAKALTDPTYLAPRLPVTGDYLRIQGISETFGELLNEGMPQFLDD